MTVLLKTTLEPTHHMVSLMNGSELELVVMPPAYHQVLSERSLVMDGLPDQIMYRIKTSVVGWKGVTDEQGKEVPFAPEAFGELCRQNPDLFIKVSDVVTPYYYGTSTAKNLPEQSAS
jgi:hypothetical protein